MYALKARRLLIHSSVLALVLGASSLGLAQDTSTPSSGSGTMKSDSSAKINKKSKSADADQGSDAKAGAATVPMADKLFIKKAAQGGMSEVELGAMAVQKGSNDEVKQFGQKMADDHGKANDELKTLAQQKGVTLPTETNAEGKAMKAKLDKLSGDQFDKAYMQHMVKDHTKDVAEFKREANNGKDPDVKAWAAKTEPTLESHLGMAKQDWAIIGGANADKGMKMGKKTASSESASQ